jgi:hypothetical protein
MKFLLAITLILSLTPLAGFSQEKGNNLLENGFQHNLTEDGKYSIKLGASMELWARYMQLNPGTKGPDNKKIDNDLDFVLRRITTSTSIKLDRFMFFSMMGLGTQTYAASASPYTTAKPAFYIYDAFASYDFIPDHLKMGYGLSLYRGLSRYTSASATRTLGADVPMLAAPDGVTTEQVARHFGLFATGSLSRLNYRLIVGKPFIVNAASKPAFGLNKAADVPNNHLSAEGYFAFQLMDKESNSMPFVSGTYLGKKKILNIGAGFYVHPKSTQSLNENGDTVSHNKQHLAIDLFLDYPVLNGGAITFYTAFFSFNYGPNYLLNGGIANVHSSTSPPGSGNSEPGFGTGTAVATQLAWLFPKIIGQTGKIQIYYEGEYRFYEGLNDAALHHNFGLNYFVFGHQLKFTLQEEFRPFIVNGSVDSYKSLTILKSQVFF